MHQWEYCYATEPNETILTMVQSALKRVPASVPGKLERLEKEGWELVAMTNASENGSLWHLIFKREK